MTLADLNFTFDTSGLNDLKTEISNSLQITNYIEETPSIIVKDLNSIVDYFTNLFNTNLENFANDIKNYFDQQAINLKNEIEESLALDPNTVYNIHVTEANHALNSDKLEGKNLTEVISYIVTNYISPATVANALKFNNKTFNEVMTYIAENVKVSEAVNADTLNNMTYEAIKNDILSSIDLGNGVDLDLIKNKVENEWTAYKANDTLKFNGYDYNYWTNTIIPGIKVNNASNADKLENKSYNDIITSVNSIVSNQIAAIYETTDFANAVKTIKVNNATNADTATNALKFNGYNFNNFISYIESNAVVDEAVNASKFDNLSSTEWKTYISNQVLNLQNNLTSGTVIPAKAQEPVSINGILVENFDDHIKDIAKEEFTELTGDINATYLNGYDFDNLMKYIAENVKVDNATNADYATDAGNSAKLQGYDYNYIYNTIKSDTISQINNEGVLTLNPEVRVLDKFTQNFKFTSLYQILFPNDYLTLPDISAFNFSYQKQTIAYNNDGNVTEIKYFAFDSDNVLLFDNDDGTTTPIIDKQYVIQHEIYTYDNNKNITKIQKDFYLLVSLDDVNPYTKITFTYNYIYDDNGNLIEIDQDTPVFTGITADDLLTS